MPFMKRKKVLFLIVLFTFFVLQLSEAQSLRFELPAHSGKTLYLTAYKGIRRDTLFSGQIDGKGNLIFAPAEDNPLSAGVVSLIIKPDINFDFIYSPLENMTLGCEGKYINAQNSQFTGSPENDFMETRFAEQAQRQAKLMFCEQGMRLYKENAGLHNILKNEKTSLEQQQASFETMLEMKSANLYSARLMIQKNLMNHIAYLEITNDSTEYARIRDYALSHWDSETLYRSGLWFSAINGMLKMYDKNSSFYNHFGKDMATLLQKTRSQEVFLELANNAATICSQFGWNTDEAALSKYLILSGRIINPKGKLKQMLTLNKLQPGMPAPKISKTNSAEINFTEEKKVLIAFYESDCSHCEKAMDQLVHYYPRLKERSFEIVSIAADADSTVFVNKSRNFPWQTKLCDFKGYEGDNFKNYGIIGVPTFYIVDKNWIIQGKYAGLEEIADAFE